MRGHKGNRGVARLREWEFFYWKKRNEKGGKGRGEKSWKQGEGTSGKRRVRSKEGGKTEKLKNGPRLEKGRGVRGKKGGRGKKGREPQMKEDDGKGAMRRKG